MKNIFKDERRPQDGEIWVFKYDNLKTVIHQGLKRDFMVVRVQSEWLENDGGNLCHSMINMGNYPLFRTNFGLHNCIEARLADCMEQRELCHHEEDAGLCYVSKEEAAGTTDLNYPFLDEVRPQNGEIWQFNYKRVSQFKRDNIVARIKGEFIDEPDDDFDNVKQLCYSCINLSGEFKIDTQIYVTSDCVRAVKCTGEALRDFIDEEITHDFSWKAKAVEEFETYIEELDAFLKEQEVEYPISDFKSIHAAHAGLYGAWAFEWLDEATIFAKVDFTPPPVPEFITVTLPIDFWIHTFGMPSDACAVMSRAMVREEPKGLMELWAERVMEAENEMNSILGISSLIQ